MKIFYRMDIHWTDIGCIGTVDRGAGWEGMTKSRTEELFAGRCKGRETAMHTCFPDTLSTDNGTEYRMYPGTLLYSERVNRTWLTDCLRLQGIVTRGAWDTIIPVYISLLSFFVEVNMQKFVRTLRIPTLHIYGPVYMTKSYIAYWTNVFGSLAMEETFISNSKGGFESLQLFLL